MIIREIFCKSGRTATSARRAETFDLDAETETKPSADLDRNRDRTFALQTSLVSRPTSLAVSGGPIFKTS